jgi:predicted Zn finger-like uncharacterized protein
MILTCPECATRYFVEDQRLGGGGRTVRCASCGSAWKAQAEEPLELTLSAEEGAVARANGEPLSFRATEPPTLADATAPELPKAFRAQVEQKRKVREAAATGIVWAGMTCAFALLLGGAYLFRVDLVKLYPRAAGAYAMAGIKVNPTGLEFEGIKAAPAADGLAAVTVTGAVRNVVDHAAAPPPLRVALLDKSGKRMAVQLLRLPAVPIAPGKATAFSISLPDPSGVANDVDVTFAVELMAPPRPAPAPARKVTQPAPAHMAPALPAPKVLAPAPAKAPPSIGQAARLRPALTSTEDARPVAANSPYALDKASPKAVSAAPNG